MVHEYNGCSDGDCELRIEPLRQHTNGGCRCLQDVPTQLRIAIQRKLRMLKMVIHGHAIMNRRYGDALREIIGQEDANISSAIAFKAIHQDTPGPEVKR